MMVATWWYSYSVILPALINTSKQTTQANRWGRRGSWLLWCWNCPRCVQWYAFQAHFIYVGPVLILLWSIYSSLDKKFQAPLDIQPHLRNQPLLQKPWLLLLGRVTKGNQGLGASCGRCASCFGCHCPLAPSVNSREYMRQHECTHTHTSVYSCASNILKTMNSYQFFQLQPNSTWLILGFTSIQVFVTSLFWHSDSHHPCLDLFV